MQSLLDNDQGVDWKEDGSTILTLFLVLLRSKIESPYQEENSLVEFFKEGLGSESIVEQVMMICHNI